MRKTTLLAVVAILLGPHLARASESRAREHEDDAGAGAGAEADARSRFVWRGVAWSRGPVLQPSAWASASGWSADVWCNVALAERRSLPSAVVASIERSIEWRALRIAPRIVGYDMPSPSHARTTAEGELSGAIDLDAFEIVSTHSFDVGAAPGAYFGTAGIAFEHERGPLTLAISGDVAWASAPLYREYFARDAFGVYLAEAALSFRWDIGDVLYAAVRAEGSALLSPALRRASEPTLLSAGAAFGFDL